MGCYSRKKKLPYFFIHSIPIELNLLFPIGIEEDEFKKGFKKRYK